MCLQLGLSALLRLRARPCGDVFIYLLGSTDARVNCREPRQPIRVIP